MQTPKIKHEYTSTFHLFQFLLSEWIPWSVWRHLILWWENIQTFFSNNHPSKIVHIWSHWMIFLIKVHRSAWTTGCMFVYLCVCMYVCSVITLKLWNQIWYTYGCMYVCITFLCTYYIYIYYLLSIIFSREDDVGGLHGIHRQGLPIAAAVTFTQIGIEAKARYVCVVLEHTYKHASICI
jgi:hypothetical protein